MYVYWWHVGGLRAVKVGHADDPRRHVSDYRSQYGLSGKDLRGYELDSGIDAEWVESHLCRMLETKGLRRIALRLGNEEEEFFALGNRTFEDVHELLRDTTRHIALAEVSNQRKQQKRHEVRAAQVRTPAQPEQDTRQAHEELRPRQRHSSTPSPVAVAARPWLWLIGTIAVIGMMTALIGDEPTLDSASAKPLEQKNPPVTTARQDGGSSARPPRDNPCTLVELSDTLIQASCGGSWASMRWNGRWTFDSGHNEGDALAFFNASDVARRVVALPPPEPVPRLSEQTEVKPERLPPSNQPAAAAAQPRPPQAAPRPATVQPQPPQETPVPKTQCSVSRPKPGFRVYLVTCPNSQVMIGRTVDSATSWTVSESVNGAEAIEFFMKSPFAR